MRTLTVLALLGVVWVGTARADLTAVTGDDYSWVAYNNLTATLGQALPANVTGFTVDNDRSSSQIPSGQLLDFGTGDASGVTLTVSEVDPGGHYLWVDGTAAQSAGTVFSDVLGASYTGNTILHDAGSTQLLTFEGLDPNSTYTFAGVATAPSGYHNSLSTVVVQDADAFVNESGLSATPSFEGREYRGGPLVSMTPASAGDTMHISFVDDDLAMWTGINPGDDGSFSVLVTSVMIGHREWAPGLDAITLAAEGSPGDLDGDGDVDADDVDLLRAGLGDPAKDMDGDGDADADDIVYLVENFLEWHRNNPGDGVGTNVGDITLDGHVDGDDLTQMKTGFGAAGGWGDGNLNTDTLVDLTDLMAMKANFGQDVGASETPEPATLVILAVGAAGLLRRRR